MRGYFKGIVAFAVALPKTGANCSRICSRALCERVLTADVERRRRFDVSSTLRCWTSRKTKELSILLRQAIQGFLVPPF